MRDKFMHLCGSRMDSGVPVGLAGFAVGVDVCPVGLRVAHALGTKKPALLGRALHHLQQAGGIGQPGEHF
jgi:hypothetical protein